MWGKEFRAAIESENLLCKEVYFSYGVIELLPLDPKIDSADRSWSLICEESAKLLYKEVNFPYEVINLSPFESWASRF